MDYFESYYKQSKGKIHPFYNGKSPLSNFYIEEDGMFNEKRYMIEKAKFFQDEQTLAEIQSSSTPYEAKQLGRKVKNFNPAEWTAVSFDVMFRCCMEKFTSSPKARSYLIGTGRLPLVEASPTDKIWGCGLSEEQCKLVDPSTWPGQNLLGIVLMKVRDTFTKGTYSLTFSDIAEGYNGRAYEIGDRKVEGLSEASLMRIKSKYEAIGYKCELLHLNKFLPKGAETPDAFLLIVRQAVGKIADLLLEEQKDLPYDSQENIYGRVVERHSRHRLCFSDVNREPNHETGDSRIWNFANTKYTKQVREKLEGLVKTTLHCHSNHYFDHRQCYIAFHGDFERNIVIGVRLGDSFTLHYQWFHQRSPVSEVITVELNHGDVYFMSKYAVGNDWQDSSRYVVRHAAGNLDLIAKYGERHAKKN